MLTFLSTAVILVEKHIQIKLTCGHILVILNSCETVKTAPSIITYYHTVDVSMYFVKYKW